PGGAQQECPSRQRAPQRVRRYGGRPQPTEIPRLPRFASTRTLVRFPERPCGFVTGSRTLGGSSPLRLVSKGTGALPGLARPGRAMKEQLLRRPKRDLNLDRHAGWCREAEDLAGAVVARDRRVQVCVPS